MANNTSKKILVKPYFRRRLQDWIRISNYNARDIIRIGKKSVLTHYDIRQTNEIGKKILFFSDLHWKRQSEFYHSLVSDIYDYSSEFKPEIIIFGGDLTSYTCHLDEALQSISVINAPVKLAIPGNWEFRRTWISKERWRQYFKQAGFTLLCQEWYKNGDVAFFGTDDFKYGNPQPPEFYMDGYRILLTHNPDTVIALSRREIMKIFHLVLCGHTHGGQIRLPGIGSIATSSIYGTHLDYGHFHNRRSDTNLLISSGLGYTAINRRLNCQSEAILVSF